MRPTWMSISTRFLQLLSFHDDSIVYYCVVEALQQLAFHYQYSAMMTMVLFIMKTNGVTRKRFVWNYEQESAFMEKQLLASYSTKMFKEQKI
jgi:hypothetical protein